MSVVDRRPTMAFDRVSMVIVVYGLMAMPMLLRSVG